MVYRIRLGEKAASGAPKRLDGKIRITSPNLAVVSEFAKVYGGDAVRWESQYQVKLARTDLPILLLPGDPLSQSWEAWGGESCQRRCDGYEQQNGQDCVCPRDLEARLADKSACRPVTRLTVVVPTVPVLGVGMLTTRSLIAAQQMPSSIEIAMPMLMAGQAVPGVLRVIAKKGAGTAYNFPQLEILGTSHDAINAGNVTPALMVGSTVPADKAEIADLYDIIKALTDDERKELKRDWQLARIPSITSVMSLADLAKANDLLQSISERPKALGAGPTPKETA